MRGPVARNHEAILAGLRLRRAPQPSDATLIYT